MKPSGLASGLAFAALAFAGMALAGLLGWGLSGQAHAAQYEPGKGLIARPQQGFSAPAAGTYKLPVIQQASNGWVFDGNWRPRRLSSYTQGALTLLSFVYTYCTDPIGCPLAYETFVDVRNRVLADPKLRNKVRLVSLSFDPSNDTPREMRNYGGKYAQSKELPWSFLTTFSVGSLLPILDGFGQDVEVELDAKGRPTRTRTHMLKVFLIDEKGRVREIYSAAFLQPEVMLNDLRTLALERERIEQPP